MIWPRWVEVGGLRNLVQSHLFCHPKWWGPPQKFNNISWLFSMFPCFSWCLGRRWMTKIHINAASRPQMLVDQMDVALLQREAIHRQWSPSPWGYWRENMGKYNKHLQTTIADDYCSIFVSRIVPPQSSTYLLFIDPRQVQFCVFHMFHSHPNTMEFSWDCGSRVTIWTCTLNWHIYALVQTKG